MIACGVLSAAAVFVSPGAQSTYSPRLGSFERLNDSRPILSPQGDGFEASGVFNPAVVRDGDRVVMLYRAQDKQGISRLGLATSTDGVTFTREPAPVLGPEAEYERGGGVEDPRLVKIDRLYYLTYTAYNGKDAQLALATSTDLRRWDRKGVILPAYKGRWNVNWTKAGAILPQRIGGRYWMYYMADAKEARDQTGVAYSTDLVTWTEALDHPVLPRRPGRFDSRVVEPGPPPLLTPEGVLLIYNGADDRLVYRTGWALFDRNDPTRLLARSDQPLFEPVAEWEKVGQVPNVVFVEGLIVEPRRWLVYYGAADKYIGVASVATAVAREFGAILPWHRRESRPDRGRMAQRPDRRDRGRAGRQGLHRGRREGTDLVRVASASRREIIRHAAKGSALADRRAIAGAPPARPSGVPIAGSVVAPALGQTHNSGFGGAHADQVDGRSVVCGGAADPRGGPRAIGPAGEWTGRPNGARRRARRQPRGPDAASLRPGHGRPRGHASRRSEDGQAAGSGAGRST